MVKTKRRAPSRKELVAALRKARSEIVRLGGTDNDERYGERNPVVVLLEGMIAGCSERGKEPSK